MPHVLLIDNFDSFTYNIVHSFEQLGAHVTCLRYDHVTLAHVAKVAPDAIVIGPGPGGPQDIPLCCQLILSFGRKIPLLGICLGHQAIGYAFGARVLQANRPLHGKTSVITHDGAALFQGLESPMTAGRYHSLIVSEASLPPSLRIDAKTEEGEIMALSHTHFPIYGVQFHPDSFLTPYGNQIFTNFLQLGKEPYDAQKTGTLPYPRAHLHEHAECC